MLSIALSCHQFVKLVFLTIASESATMHFGYFTITTGCINPFSNRVCQLLNGFCVKVFLTPHLKRVGRISITGISAHVRRGIAPNEPGTRSVNELERVWDIC